MKVTYGAIVQRASGRFGGTVHSNWKGIDVVRRFANPSNPNTSSQIEVRDAFASLTKSFTLQTATLRAAWDTFAVGKPFISRNKWIGVNVPNLTGLTDLSDIQTTPGDASTIPLLAFTPTGGVGVITSTTTAPAEPAGWTLNQVAMVACIDWDPSNGIVDPASARWFEGLDATTPFTPTITGLAAGTYRVAAFIEWLAPDASKRYSASIVRGAAITVT